MSLWSGIACDPFPWKGKDYRERDIVKPLTHDEMLTLLNAGMIGAPTRIPEPVVETATAPPAPETTAKNYRRSAR